MSVHFQQMKYLRVLHVDDDVIDAHLIAKHLQIIDDYHIDLVHCVNTHDAHAKLREQTFHAILLDLNLEQSKGMDTITNLQEASEDTAVIILTGSENSQHAFDALQLGAQDFLHKSLLNANMLLRSIIYSVYRKQAEIRMRKMVYQDSLTGLANRLMFNDRLEQAIARVQRQHGSIALLFIDLDHFKHINDRYGHDVGDELLCIVAQRLKKCVRDVDTVARLAGDEFVIILEEADSEDDIEHAAGRLLEALSTPVEANDINLNISGSIGACLYPHDDIVYNAEQLCRCSDIAMYHAKKAGRNQWRLFKNDMLLDHQHRQTVESSLLTSLLNKEFYLEYQPVVDSQTQHMTGAEALIRWNHPEKGILEARHFIHEMENSGDILILGEWILQTACAQWAKWTHKKMIAPSCRLTVNISLAQVQQASFAPFVEATIKDTQINPAQLEVELSELVLAESSSTLIKNLNMLRQMKVGLSINNFGNQYALLHFIQEFPNTRLRVNKRLLPEKENDQKAFIDWVVAMADKHAFEVIVEGIESAQEIELANSIQSQHLQGFLFSHPENAQDFILHHHIH